MRVQATMIRAPVSLISTMSTTSQTTIRIIPIIQLIMYGIKSAGLFFTAPTTSKMPMIRTTT